MKPLDSPKVIAPSENLVTLSPLRPSGRRSIVIRGA